MVKFCDEPAQLPDAVTVIGRPEVCENTSKEEEGDDGYAAKFEF